MDVSKILDNKIVDNTNKLGDKIKSEIEGEVKSLNFKELLHIYIRECVEVFLLILIVKTALGKPLEIFHIIKASLLLGILTTLLEIYDKDYKKSIRGGMNTFTGIQLVSSFVNN